MITPEEIREKARRLYSEAVAAWLSGTEMFPRYLPVNRKPSKVVSEAIAEQQALREQAKPNKGYGYSLEFEEVNSRGYGQQRFVSAVYFESRDDLLRLIGKVGEFQRLTRMVNEIRQRQPRLNGWLNAHWKRLVGLEDELSHLLDVVDYLLAHPRPNCFLRELPLALSTKLVERNSGLLALWLDELLPPHAIDFGFDRQQFAGRYGFRSVDDQLWLRVLDPQLQVELNCPGSELALPRATLSSLPVRDVEVVIVENKINLLTLPPRRRTLALGGLGRGVSQLYRIEWLDSLPINYFGDIDIEGLQILAHVRNRWPQTRSWLMDLPTLEEFRELIIPGNPHASDLEPPSELTESERAAFIACRDQNLRLEQERIPQSLINARFGISPQPKGASPG